MLQSQKTWFSWLNPDWFRISTFQSFDWQEPVFLYLLLLIPLLYLGRWLIRRQTSKKVEIAFFKENYIWHWSSLLRFIPHFYYTLFLTLVIIALARPQRTSERITRYSEGIDIMLVLDTSGSMELQDLKPNRLESAKEVALHFIQGRSQDRIGMVVFAGDAYALTPLTSDYNLLRENIKTIKLKMIPNDGTAIGSALAVAINRMRDSPAKSKVCILISDGENTAGNLDPATAAKLAMGFNIKIYTVGIGQDGLVPLPGQNNQTSYIQTRLDETTLREVAQTANGTFYRASDKNALNQIFERINQLEKAEIKENRFRDTKDFYQVYLKWAMLVFLVWLLLKNTFLSNALED